MLLSTVTVAARSAGTTGGATATFSFDTSILDATYVILTNPTGTTLTTGVLTSTMNLGGGTAALGAVTIAINTVANATASPGAAIATLNMSGGAVTAASINMANAVNTGITKVATSTISITGGSLTMAGDRRHFNSPRNTAAGFVMHVSSGRREMPIELRREMPIIAGRRKIGGTHFFNPSRR